MDYQALSEAVPGTVYLPGSSEYVASTGSYFAAFENELSPACVVQPKNAQQIAAIINWCRESTAAAGPALAVRSGGHTPWAGAANIDGGITLDLQKLTGVEINASTNTVTIGAGERWASVYTSLEAQGLAIVGGRVSKVGVGGLVLGGGLSYFSARTGFVCDNVVNYEVVLASGEIVQANAKSHSDLFLALKGGSNNFGIVTKFEFPTFKQGQMWGGAIYYNASIYPQLIQEFHDFAVASPPDEDAHLIIAAACISGTGELAVSNVYHATPVVEPPSLKPFVSLQPQLFNSLRNDSLLGFAQEQSKFTIDGARQLYFTTSFKVDVELMIEIRSLWLDSVKSLEAVEGLAYGLVFQPLTKGLLEQSASRGGNSFGLKPEDGPLAMTQLNLVYTSRADDEKVVAAALAFVEQIENLSAKKGKAARYRFTNYGYKTQPILQGYGPESVQRLKAASEKYDPTGFFQKTVPGGFKVSAVN